MIFCFFGITDFVFATNTIDLGRIRSVTVKGDGNVRIVRPDARVGSYGINNMVSGLSRANNISGTYNTPTDHSSEMFRVLSVIGNRVGDETLLKKIADKLPAMSDDRLQMVASLSERIAAEDHGAKSDIAFLLLTTLIIFS